DAVTTVSCAAAPQAQANRSAPQARASISRAPPGAGFCQRRLDEERDDAPRNVFDKRSSHAMRLVDAAAQASHLTYEHLNPVAAGLVARPEHMPGTTLDGGHWKAGGIWIERADFYFSSDRPDALRLELTPPPLLMRA